MTAKQGKIDFKKPHAPLLFIGGEKDNITPASLNRKNVKAYKHKDSIVDYKEFEGRTHILCAQENWEEIAAYIHNWIETK
ncbi:MAG: alpha/beta hydrolase [Aureispira sp.]|nr:alpha/beta hydrolase [Aureispira sp.]